MWEYYQSCRYDRHTALELTSWNCILWAVSNMRPVTWLPPGHANRDWGISVKCHYQGCTLVRVFVFLSICWCAMSNRLVFMPMKSFTQFQSLRLLLLSLFLSLLPSFYPVFFFCHSFPPRSLCPRSSPPSILFLPLSFSPILTSNAPLLPSPCQHCHSLGSPSVYYRPLTTSSLYGTFSF